MRASFTNCASASIAPIRWNEKFLYELAVVAASAREAAKTDRRAGHSSDNASEAAQKL
jgi:hypothetical protein